MTMIGVKLCPLCNRPVSEHPLPGCFLRPLPEPER